MKVQNFLCCLTLETGGKIMNGIPGKSNVIIFYILGLVVGWISYIVSIFVLVMAAIYLAYASMIPCKDLKSFNKNVLEKPGDANSDVMCEANINCKVKIRGSNQTRMKYVNNFESRT